MARNARAVPLREGIDGSVDRYDEDNRGGMDGSYSSALSRSIEVSSLLLGRSPWMAQSPPQNFSSRDAHESARERSISIASNAMQGGSEGSNRSVQLEEGEAGEAFLRPMRDNRASSSGKRSALREPLEERDTDKDYDPVTGEELPDLDAEHKYEEQPPLSSFWQSVFNSTNLLMGVGLLSLPYACRLAGWLALPILVVLALITNYTAKLLGQIMEYQPSVKLREGPGAYTIYGFADMGFVAFGDFGRYLMFVIFIVETFGYACVYIIIEGENLRTQLMHLDAFAGWRKMDFLVLSTCVFLPPMWLPNLSVLSYMSAFGVFSSLVLLFGVILEGAVGVEPNTEYCTLPQCTGSWLHPSPTTMYKVGDLPIVIGLVMVGFAGHAVFPTIRNDMERKQDYGRMVDVTYVLVLFAYTGMTVCGYLMFGDKAEEEVTVNLGKTLVSHIIVWIVLSNPVCKYPLDMAPIAFGLESFVQITFKIPYNTWLFTLVSLLIRTLLVFVSLAAVLAIPSFAVMVALLGSLGSFTISVTFPCACYLKLYWADLSLSVKVLNIILVVLGVLGAGIGVYGSIVGGATADLATLSLLPPPKS